jgi:hypothetical protein
LVLTIDVTEYFQPISSREVGLSRDAFSAKLLRHKYAPHWFSSPVRRIWQPDLNAPPGFDRYVAKYAEVVLRSPWDDIVMFYDQSAKLGGAPTPLGFPPRFPLLNTAAMAMAAEALAGWYCQSTRPWAFLGRPQRVSPDMIFYDRAKGQFALIEVKSSGTSSFNIERRLTSDMIKLLRTLALTKQLNTGRYFAGVVMVRVTGRTSAALDSLLLEEI